MQYIYAFETSVAPSAAPFERLLEKSILSVKDQYLYLLQCIRSVANFVETDAKIKAGKYIKDEKDKNFNTKLLSNIIVQYLNNDQEFLTEINNANTASLIDEDSIRSWYKKFIATPEYQQYLNSNNEFNLEEDKAIILFLLNVVLHMQNRLILIMASLAD